jgi:hypothetical protein
MAGNSPECYRGGGGTLKKVLCTVVETSRVFNSRPWIQLTLSIVFIGMLLRWVPYRYKNDTNWIQNRHTPAPFVLLIYIYIYT